MLTIYERGSRSSMINIFALDRHDFQIEMGDPELFLTNAISVDAIIPTVLMRNEYVVYCNNSLTYHLTNRSTIETLNLVAIKSNNRYSCGNFYFDETKQQNCIKSVFSELLFAFFFAIFFRFY